LERHVELQSKSYGRELKEVKAKYKQAAQDAERWQELYEAISLQLREKNKELEIKNIYSQRIVKNIPRVLPSVQSISTRDAASNTDPIPSSDVRSAVDMVSRTPISLAESMVIGLREDKSPSPDHPLPHPPSHPRPHNRPRRASPLTSSHVLSSSVVRDGATGNVDVNMKNDAGSLEWGQKLHSKSPHDSNMSSEVDMEQLESRGKPESPIVATFVTQSSKAEAGVGPGQTVHDEHRSEAPSLTTPHMTAQEEQRKKNEQEQRRREEEQRKQEAEERRTKDLLLAKLRAIDAGLPADSVTELTIASETRAQPDKSPVIDESRPQPSNTMTELTVSNRIRDLQQPEGSSSDKLTTKGFEDVEIQGNSWSGGNTLFSSDVVRDGQTNDREQQHINSSDTASVASKASSHHTWNQRIENMHSGRPALSTEENYYGTQSAGRRVTEQQNAIETDSKLATEYAPSLGSQSSSKRSDSNKDHQEDTGNSVKRRHKPPLTGSITKLDANNEIPIARKTDDVGKASGYQPSFVIQRNTAGAGVLDKKLPVKFAKTKAYPWETDSPVLSQKKVSDQSDTNRSTNSFEMLSSQPLLKRSERQELGNLLGNMEWNGQHENMNDDDIEEVVI
jgi:hypothetical protein